MTFVWPGFLVAGGIASAAIIALHFLARAEPVVWVFPTARFVPASTARAVSRSLAPNDLLLLALRLLGIVAITLAFAQPSFTTGRQARTQVIVADFSRAANRQATFRAAQAALTLGDRVVVVDSVSRVVPADSLAAVANAPVRMRRAASLSAALLVAIGEARRAAETADAVAITIVSPLVAEEVDAAMLPIRATFAGAVTVQRTASDTQFSSERRSSPRIALRAATEDPLRATLTRLHRPLASNTSSDAPLHLVREASLTAADSAFAREGGTVVHWPARIRGTNPYGAVVTNAAVVVASLTSAPLAPGAAHPLAHFADGSVAADEAPLGAGCVRRVAIPVASAGDFAIRGSVAAVVQSLLGVCGDLPDARPVTDSVLGRLRGTARNGSADAKAMATGNVRVTRVLLVIALLALTGEWWLRKRQVAG